MLENFNGSETTMSEQWDIEMGRGRTLHCPKCGKKARTFLKPKDERRSDYRLQCKCTSLEIYLMFTVKKSGKP